MHKKKEMNSFHFRFHEISLRFFFLCKNNNVGLNIDNNFLIEILN